MPHSSSAPRSRPHHRRCHRHRLRSVTTAHPRRRAGCRRSRSLLLDVRASALVDRARSVADAALVVRTHAVVHVVADAIGIGVRSQSPPTRQGVELVAVAVAVSFWDVRTSALVDRARTVADAALVEHPRSRPRRRRCHRHRRPLRSHRRTPKRVELVAVAVAISFWDVRTSALVDRPGPLQMPHSSYAPTQSSTSSQMPSASASAAQSPPHTPKASSWLPSQSQSPSGMSNIRTRRWRQDRCRCRTRRSTHAVVDVVADAIGIGVRCAVTTTHAQGVELVAVAVAVSFWDVRTSALVDGARTVADAALVVRTNAVVHVVADAIGIGVRHAVTTTHAQGVELVAVAVAVPSGMSEHPHS